MNGNLYAKTNLLFLNIIITLNLIILTLSDCPREFPILKNNNCTSIYCNEDQFRSGECSINNTISKAQWLNNIIKFENTNGDIFLDASEDTYKIIFSTTLSNNQERIFYAKENDHMFFFRNYDDDNKSFIIKNIASENKEMTNGHLYLISSNFDFIMIIGNENSDIEILNLNFYKNDIDFIPQSTFLNDSKIIKGLSSYCKDNAGWDLYCATITAPENNPSNYSLSLYSHFIEVENEEAHLSYSYSFELNNIKGNYSSCFTYKNKYISCFYLDKNNTYVVTLFEICQNYFKKNNTLIIGTPSDLNEDKIYFFKGILIDINFAIFAYYSGDFNEVPTFKLKSINSQTYAFSDKYSELPIVHLHDYEFNNDLKFNDLIKNDLNSFIFISTSKDKKTLIIAEFKVYKNSNTNNNDLAIRYYTIEFKKYYNMQILQGFKALFFKNCILTLALNYFYCSNESCENIEGENRNTSLIFFSYANNTDVKIDFIEYAFTYNRNYIIIDLEENLKIENNIFGMFYSIYRSEWDLMNGIEYFLLSNNENIIEEETYRFEPEDAKIKISFEKYSLDKIDVDLLYTVEMSTSNDVSIFNEYIDKFNNTYGDTEIYASLTKKKYDSKYHYYYDIKSDLSVKCDDSNCTLCLRNYSDYCLVCKDEYTILYNKSYYNGKKKICRNISITDYLSYNEEMTNPESSNIYTIIKTEVLINNTEISTNGKISNFDISTIPELIKSEDMTNNIDIPTIQKSINIINTEELSSNIDIFTIQNTLNIDISTITEVINKEELIDISIIQNTSNIDFSSSLEEIKTEQLTNNIDIPKIQNTSKIDFITISEEINTEKISTKIELTIDNLVNGKFKDTNLSDEEIKYLYDEVKDYLLNNYDGNDTIINSGNVKVQISPIDSKNSYEELSDIDLGECAEILKSHYCKTENDSLLILKFDIIPQNKKSTYVQYKIYNPNSKLFLELKECTGSNIAINIPIDLNNDIESLYEQLSESGYNLFDANSSFYNDICASYTTPNGTDILLYDRRMDIYQKTLNISLCQDGCKFESYNLETKKAKCNCLPQAEEIYTNTSELEFNVNEMIDEFYEILKNSNFKVLKCYILPFNPNIFIKNIGSIVMTILLVLFLSLIIFFISKRSKQINFLIEAILKLKEMEKTNNKELKNNKNLTFDKKNNNIHKDFIRSPKKEKLEKDISKKTDSNKFSPLHKKRKLKKKKKQELSLIPNHENLNEENQEPTNLEGKQLKSSRNKLISNNSNSMYAPPKRRTISNVPDSNYQDSDCKNIISKKSFKGIKHRYISAKNIPLDFSINKLSNECNNEKSNQNEEKNGNNENNENNNKLENDINISPYHRKHKSSLKLKLDSKKKKVKISNNKERNSDKNAVFFDLRIKKKSGTNISRRGIQIQVQDKSTSGIQNKKEVNKEEKKELLSLNDEELNTLEYEKAIELDKRTYFQYYYSLLKKKQLILFTFLPTNDYNVMSLKISLFIVSFSLYFTINAFFFNDSAMHKIYKENGIFNILQQIPQIFYSSIIPSIINMLLKTLSLSEKDVIKLKKEEDYQKLVKESKKVERIIIIKIIIFFIISLLFMLFFWYFISCFCAVYNNTQIILIKDTLISFAMSMAYPFGLNLIPGFFRIPALKSQKKDEKCLYKISQYIALFL